MATYVGRDALFLLPQAVECLLKAWMIRNGEQATDTMGNLKKKFKNHDLPLLAKGAGLKLSKEDLGVLKFLSSYQIWQGRYPVPTSPKGYPENIPGLGTTGEATDNAFALCNLLWKEFNTMAPATAASKGISFEPT